MLAGCAAANIGDHGSCAIHAWRCWLANHRRDERTNRDEFSICRTDLVDQILPDPRLVRRKRCQRTAFDPRQANSRRKGERRFDGCDASNIRINVRCGAIGNLVARIIARQIARTGTCLQSGRTRRGED